MQDMNLTNERQSLIDLFVKDISKLSVESTTIIKSKVAELIVSQASFIQALFGNILWES